MTHIIDLDRKSILTIKSEMEFVKKLTKVGNDRTSSC